MKKILVVLFSFVLFFGGCEKKDVISKNKIGIMLPLTGEAAFIGQPMKKAISLAFEKKIKNNEVELIFQDTKASPKYTVAIYKKLRTKQIKYFIGPAASGAALSVAPLVEKDNVFIVSPSASNYRLSQYPNFYRVELSDKQGASKQAELAYRKLKWKKISVLYINNEYGVGVSKEFIDKFKKIGGKINVSLAYDQTTTNFRNHIEQISHYNNDAIFMVAQNKYPIIIKQFRELKNNTPIYATPVIKDSKTFETLGKSAGNIIFTYYGQFGTNNESDSSKIFKKLYSEKYNNQPSYYAALAYDAAKVIIAKINNDSFEIINGVTGDMRFDNNGDVNKIVLLYKWDGSKIEELQ